MNPILSQKGEIDLICNNTQRYVPIDGLENWQADALLNDQRVEEHETATRQCLQAIDNIAIDWIRSLTDEEKYSIKKRKSLYGIQMPKMWIKVWRLILRNKNLRNSKKAARNGSGLNTYSYIWNLWAEDCIEKYLNDLDKELLSLVDAGYMRCEIGEYLFGKYGDKFWKKRKENSTTTFEQVVNNYMYQKLPNKIARQELYEIAKVELNI